MYVCITMYTRKLYFTLACKTLMSVLLTISIFFSSDMLNAQPTLQWAIRVGGPNNDKGSSVAVDGSGNVYSTGYFEGTVDFDPGPGVVDLTSGAGSRAIFILKLDALGNYIWAKRIGANIFESSSIGNSITVDGTGNVYVTGYFYHTVDFDPGTGITNLTSAGMADVFVLKLDGLGNYVWAKGFGAHHQDFGFSITVDGSGNVYTIGSFRNTAFEHKCRLLQRILDFRYRLQGQNLLFQ